MEPEGPLHNGAHLAMAVFVGVAWYNVVELVNLIFLTFKRYNGMYFWSMLISSLGVCPYSIGYLMKFFKLTDATWLPVTLLTIGWWTMVTGQSFVLYSRLHFILQNARLLRILRNMIIVNAFLFHVPTTVLTFLDNLRPSGASTKGYEDMEKIQLTGFCVQEVILSGIYMWETNRMMQHNPDHVNRKTIRQLFAVNLLCILMDIALMVIEFMGLYQYQTTLKATLYSIKLKLEIAVLGRLVRLAHQHVWRSQFNGGTGRYPSFVDATKLTSPFGQSDRLPPHPLSPHLPSPGPLSESSGSKPRQTPIEDLDADAMR